MPNEQIESPIFKLLRWFVALAFALPGCWAYFAAPMIGAGLHLDPMPGLGMVIAGMAFLAMMAGYSAVWAEKRAEILATVIELVLGFGAISLLIGVVQWGYETFYSVQKSEAGHSAVGAVFFRICYGGFSVAAFIIFNKWFRKTPIGIQS